MLPSSTGSTSFDPLTGSSCRGCNYAHTGPLLTSSLCGREIFCEGATKRGGIFPGRARWRRVALSKNFASLTRRHHVKARFRRRDRGVVTIELAAPWPRMPRGMNSKVRQVFDRPGVASTPTIATGIPLLLPAYFRTYSAQLASPRGKTRRGLCWVFDKRPPAVRLGRVR